MNFFKKKKKKEKKRRKMNFNDYIDEVFYKILESLTIFT